MSIEKPTYAEQSFAFELGKRLKKSRLACKVSQAALADALEVHRNRIYHWETGESIMSLHMALKIVGVLRCDLNCLLPSSSFVWGRELPKRPPQRYSSRSVAEERDPPLTDSERSA
jgi:DNA-binding XRE family transcriptional regulator